MIPAVVAFACMLAAATVAGETPEVTVGFDGVYRTGSWTPLTVRFPAAADGASHAADSVPEAVAVWVEDPDGQYVRYPAEPLAPGIDGGREARLTVRCGRPTARVLVEQTAADGGVPSSPDRSPAPPALDPVRMVRHSLPAPIPASDTVVLVLGDLPAAERASRLLAREDGTRPRVVAFPPATAGREARDAATLGRTARDFDGADAIIVCGRAVESVPADVLRGIDGWVRQGGQLLFVAGVSAIDVARGTTAAAGWLPGAVAKLVPLRRGNAIETFARASRPLDKAALSGLQLPLFAEPQMIEGSVEAFEGRGPADLPLVVRRAHGLGTVVWAGIDIDQPPFRDWSGSDSLLVEMLRGRRAGREAGRTGETARGSLDLAGQLRQAIDQFRGVAPIPFEVIAGLGILYVACLYPLDWWLVSGRRAAAPGGPRAFWLAWLSLPLLVAATSGLAWAAGQRFKGTAWQTSAASLVDLDAGSGLVRAASFTGVWSPINARLDMAAAADAQRLPVSSPSAADGSMTAVSWFAACGRGIGGTDAPAAHPSLAAAAYGYAGSSAALAGAPIAAASSRLFEADLVGTTTTRTVESTLAKEGQGTLKGAITSRLNFALERCVLVHAGWLYDVGALAPGQTFEPGRGRGPRSLAGAVTHRTQNKEREVAVRWDLAERDPMRILELAGFHAAAGGSGYSSLESGRLGRFDLSPLLPLDRAVLVGRGPALIDWQCRPESIDGRDSAAADAGQTVPPVPGQDTLWRIVIPLVRPDAAVTPSPNPLKMP